MTSNRYPDAETLLTEAQELTGLSDFGPGDFREGLDVLLDSLEHDSDLDPAADAGVVGAFRRRLVNRLQVEAWYRDHPEIDDLPVRGPVDINGLPRTGTTALANMMSLDPQFRSLRGWEQEQPVPPPTPETEEHDPRRLDAKARHDAMPPEVVAMHLFDVDATMEDTEVLGMAFHGQQYTLPVYRYHAWWRECDMVPTFHYHRRVVKLLQSQRPPNLWLFKAPHHDFHTEEIAAAYPDARFVMTHRDPARAIPSWASLMATASFPPAAGERDLHRLGQEAANHLRIGVDKAIAARDRVGHDRYIDVHHHDMVADPIGTLRRVYEFLQLDFLPSFEQAVLEWHQRNRSGAHGTHEYTLEQFGLTKSQVHSDYDHYIRTFDVKIG